MDSASENITLSMVERLKGLWKFFSVFETGKIAENLTATEIYTDSKLPEWIEAKTRIFEYLRSNTKLCDFLAEQAKGYGLKEIFNDRIFPLYCRDQHHERELQAATNYPTLFELQAFGINAGNAFKEMWKSETLFNDLIAEAKKDKIPIITQNKGQGVIGSFGNPPTKNRPSRKDDYQILDCINFYYPMGIYNAVYPAIMPYLDKDLPIQLLAGEMVKGIWNIWESFQEEVNKRKESLVTKDFHEWFDIFRGFTGIYEGSNIWFHKSKDGEIYQEAYCIKWTDFKGEETEWIRIDKKPYEIWQEVFSGAEYVETQKDFGYPNPLIKILHGEVDRTVFMQAIKLIKDKKFNAGIGEQRGEKKTVQAPEAAPDGEGGGSDFPHINYWNELCIGNTDNISIYMSKAGQKGRDYSFIEIPKCGDKRKNKKAKSTKIWEAIRYYAFGEGNKNNFDKNDLSRANTALKSCFKNAEGKPFPISKSGIQIIIRDAMDRQKVKMNDDYSGKSEAENAEIAEEMQYMVSDTNDEME